MVKRRGFTLIELLVVVSIIALLIAILLPGMARARKQSKSVVCQTHLRGLSLATRVYVQNWGKVFPCGQHWNKGSWDYLLLSENQSLADMSVNNGYSKGGIDKLRTCPEATQAAPVPSGGSTNFNWGSAGEQWSCPASVSGTRVSGSYGFNGWLFDVSDPNSLGYQLAMPWSKSGADTRGFYRAKNIAKDSEVPAFTDCTWHDFWPRETDGAPGDAMVPDKGVSIVPDESNLRGASMDRHGRAVNVAFYDGHLEHVKLADLWTLKWSANWTRTNPQVMP